MLKIKTDISTTFINLSSHSKFEEKLFTNYPRLNFDKNLDNITKNNIYRKLFIDQPEWSGFKNECIYTLESTSETNNKIFISRTADLIFNFALSFENCDKDIINKIHFLINDKVIDEVSATWIDIYQQMFSQKKKTENICIIPSFHFRNYLPIISPYCNYNDNYIQITLNKKLEGNQKINLFAKQSCISGARRTQLSKMDISNNFFYDRIISKNYQPPSDKSLLEIKTWELWDEYFSRHKETESLSSLSEIFISVKKKTGFDTNKEVVKNISFGFEGTVLYKEHSPDFFKNINPLLGELQPSIENNDYQGHYLISFSNICQQENKDKEWKYRGGINMNTLTNVWLDINLNENIPKETYEIVLTYVCPTYLS